MNTNEIKKDIEFIKSHTLQPSWFKRAKVFILLVILLVLLVVLGFMKTIILFLIFFGLASIVHFMYRKKTNGFTKSWMDFKVKEVEGERVYERIGFLYYSLVIIIFLLSIITVLLIN